MVTQKPAIPKGTRDFGPAIMVRRNYILETIKKTYQQFGYLPLETPALENISVLTGNYGDEGDQLLFKILNSGDFLSKVDKADIDQGYKKLLPKISNKGLKYDLTVPFARFVAMNRHEINFPFKRYQIQPVWRADNPQMGRYREFYQCDADVIGSESLICEAEIISLINQILNQLGIHDFILKMNHRSILAGISEEIGAPDKVAVLCVAIDKLEKIGQEKVSRELEAKGFTPNSITRLFEILEVSGTNQEILSKLSQLLKKSTPGTEGLKAIQQIFAYADNLVIGDHRVQFDPSLARGLSYYTGAIFEVQVNNQEIGSIGGGGRYDDLTSIFGLPGVSGVGFSFGVDRVYDVMEKLQLFPEFQNTQSQVLVTIFDDTTVIHALQIVRELRKQGLTVEIFPDTVKLKKQLNHAHKKSIPFVIILGPDEIANNQLTLKNMATGHQTSQDLNTTVNLINSTQSK
ncbi:MAG: histidine--tRNA ligase [Bacteroidetes bacterium]|nr:histidine--tRNA ligase [Bacteroidota bacterium]